MPYDPFSNTLAELYFYANTNPSGRARHKRESIAEERQEIRDMGRQRDWAAKCALDWVNSTFNGALTELPKGTKCEPNFCPLANAIRFITTGSIDTYYSNTYVNVDINDIVVDGRHFDPPECVTTFVKNFDYGRHPQLVI